MRLTTASLERTVRQFKAEPIPEDHPLVDKLNSVFGEHTFLLGADGLHVVEPTGSAQADANTATGGEGRKLGRRQSDAAAAS